GGRSGLHSAVWGLSLPLVFFKTRGPRPEIPRHGNEGRIGEQVDAAFETFGGDAILDRGNLTVASRAVVDVSQAHLFRRDSAICSLAHISRGGKHQGAEDSDPDQRQLERRRP